MSNDDTQSLCARLDANDPHLTYESICIDTKGEEDLERIFETIQKKNDTLENLVVYSAPNTANAGVLSVGAVLALYAAVRSHPKLQKLEFVRVSLTELSPIVLAVLENDCLTSLSLQGCRVPSHASMMGSLQILLQRNVLESLSVRTYRSSEGIGTLDLSVGALANAKRLEKLQVWAIAVSSETVLGMAELLQSNPGLQVLELSNANLTSRMVQSIAEAATGHPSLQKLTMRQSQGLDTAAAQAIGAMVGNTPGLRVLDVSECSMGPVAACHIFEGLKSKQCTLEDLKFNDNDMGDDGAIALGAALETNSSVKDLRLRDNNIGSAGASAIATVLTKNKTLEWLHVSRNQIGDDGAVAMSEMLTTNSTLSGLVVGDLGERGLDGFITCLPQMRGIEFLPITSVEGFTTDTANSLVRALEQNTVLTCLGWPSEPPAAVEIWPKVNLLLDLNSAGRRYLKATPSIPSSYWPYILAKSSKKPDVLFHFVRELPDVLFTNTRTNKRKREGARGILSLLWDSTCDLLGRRKRLRHD